MEIDALRSIITVLAFVAFIGIVAWAFSRRRRRSFDEAAQLPFHGDRESDEPVAPASRQDRAR